MTKDVISLSISVLLLFRHYISHKITFGAPSSGGVLCSACGAFISFRITLRSLISSGANSSFDRTVATFSDSTLQICLIIALSLRSNRLRSGLVTLMVFSC